MGFCFPPSLSLFLSPPYGGNKDKKGAGACEALPRLLRANAVLHPSLKAEGVGLPYGGQASESLKGKPGVTLRTLGASSPVPKGKRGGPPIPKGRGIASYPFGDALLRRDKEG